MDKLKASSAFKLNPTQLLGVSLIIDEWNAQGYTDDRQLAYVLGTVYHETAGRMMPIKEMGGEAYLKSKSYYPYYGRDLCQTTWLKNYQRVKDFSGIDVVTNPDLIAEPQLAARVAIHFMSKGYYTGRKLSDFFNNTTEDYLHARRIINGLDKAEVVAEHAKKFLV